MSTTTQVVRSQVETVVAPVVAIAQPTGNATLILDHSSKQTYLAAMRALQLILSNSEEMDEPYWFSTPFSRLLGNGGALREKIEASEETLSPELTSEISTQIDALTGMLTCCLSSRPLQDPVLDPAVTTVPKLVFERGALLDYYAKRKKAFTEYNIPIKATDLTTLVTGDLPEPAQLPTAPFVCDLVRWRSRFFPQPQSEETGPTVTLTVYMKRIRQMQDNLNTLQTVVAVEHSERQLGALVRYEENTARFSEQSRQQAEDADRAATESLKQELQRLKDSCNSNIQLVEASVASVEEKLQQKTALTETLAKKMQTLKDEHLATLREQRAMEVTIRQAGATLSDEKQDHIKTKEQATKEKQSLQQQTQYLQSRLTEQESRTRAVESRVSALNSELSSEMANYRELQDKYLR